MVHLVEYSEQSSTRQKVSLEGDLELCRFCVYKFSQTLEKYISIIAYVTTSKSTPDKQKQWMLSLLRCVAYRQMKNWNFFGWYLILNIIFRCFSSSKVRCWHAEGFLRARHCRLVAFVSCLLWWSSWSKHDKTIHLKNTQWRSKKWGNYIKNLLKSLSLWPCVTP